jgi:PAS domain S-box-containing protein
VEDIANDPLWLDYKGLALKEGLRSCWSTPILDAQGRLLGTFAIYHKTLRVPDDHQLRLLETATHTAAVCITRHQAEHALHQSRERFASLVSSIDGVVWEADPVTGHYLFVSQAASRVLGFPTEDWLADGFRSQHVHPEDRDRAGEFYRDLGLEGSAREIEYRMLHRDGRVIWVQDLVTVSIQPNEPQLVRGLLLDITNRKNAEEERNQIQLRLQRSERMESLGTLAGGIAHDFNNLLGVILGNAELLQVQLPDDVELRLSVSELRGAALRARDLVKQILAYSRDQPAQLHETLLSQSVEEAARLLRATIPTSIAIQTHITPNCPTVLADPVQIHQVLLNLGTNAWHAMESKPGVLTIRLDTLKIEPSSSPSSLHLPVGEYVCLSVQDQGTGMDRTTRERMFDPFFTTKEVGKGTGLGMSIVQRIVASHGATLEVTTAPGEGTSIDIYFPVAAPTPASAKPMPSSLENPPRQTGRILLIDDELSLVDLGKRTLGKIGYYVEGFTQPDLALERFRQDPQSFDLVITDLNMPGQSGLEVIDTIRKQRTDLPVVLGSGHITDELRADAMARGVREVFYKPCTLNELTEIVNRVLASSHKS